MKTLIQSFLILIFITLLAVNQAVYAGDEFRKVIKKEYQVNPDAQLSLNNKFGKIHIANWDKNEISVEVTVTVTASDQEAADKKFKRYNINFSGTPSMVSVTTEIEDGKGTGKGHFSVDYYVQMPTSNQLDVTNKFGDVFINEINGKARIDLGYGNAEIKKLNNSDNLIEVKFGKARINFLKGAVISLKYSQMSIDYAGSLRLNSKFSDLDAQKIIALNMVLEGGKLSMEKTSAIDSRSKFSDIEIGRIDQTLNLEIQYGKCDVHEMPSDFSSITIHNKFADVSVGLDQQSRYQLDAEMKFCDLEFPEDKAKLTFRSTTPSTQSFKGIIGGGETSPVSKVNVTSEYGDVELK